MITLLKNMDRKRDYNTGEKSDVYFYQINSTARVRRFKASAYRVLALLAKKTHPHFLKY